MSLSRKGYKKKLYRLAQREGWVMPGPNTRYPPEAWNHYWRDMLMAQKGHIEGRPLPPHMPGGGWPANA